MTKNKDKEAIFAAIGFNFKQILNWLALVFCFFYKSLTEKLTKI